MPRRLGDPAEGGECEPADTLDSGLRGERVKSLLTVGETAQ